jgi:hypothetical protein
MAMLVLCALVCARGAVLSSFQAGTGGWQLGTLAVADVVGDSQLEIVVPYRDSNGSWFLDAFDWRGNRLAGFPYAGGSLPINVSPTLYDLDGDGKAEIFFTCGPNVVALNGNGTVRWTHPVSFLNYVPDSGFMAVTNGFYMTPLGLFQPTLPATAQFFSEVSPPIIADLAGNGRLELLTAWKINPDSLLGQQDYNPFINDIFGQGGWGATGESWSGGVIGVDARTGASTLTYHFHQLVESGLAVGQADEDAAREVYVLNDADSVAAFDRTQPHGFYGKGMLHKMFGKNQRLLSGAYQTGVDVYTAEVDGDGRDECLVASQQIDPNWEPSETLLDDDGAIQWRKWLPALSYPRTFGWFNSACMIPVNPDHDNRIDVLSFTGGTKISFRSWNGVDFVDRPGWPKDFAPRLPTPPVVGDIDGDGEEEIIIGTYDPAQNPSNGSLYIFSLAGVQKNVITVPGGLKHIPSIADVNGDGSVDLVYRALDGKVYVQNFGATAGARVSWATHRGNARRDGNMGANLFPAGTPIVTARTGGYAKAEFSWKLPNGFAPSGFEIYRGTDPNGALVKIAGLATDARSFVDGRLEFGRQYIYEIAAIYPSGTVRSAPFAILSLLNYNLVANGGFEENDNSHWDKWFTGEIPWDRMIGSRNAPAGGAQSMEIQLVNDSSQSSITQYSHYGIPESYIKTAPGMLYSFGGFICSGGLSAASEHWFEWDSSKTGEDPSARPPLPWLEYFTPSLRAGTGATGWTYLNRVFEMPPGFPNVELRHRFTTSAPATGSVFLDNVFFRALPAMTDSRWNDLLAFGSTWKYSVNAPAANWFATEFPDATWTSGIAKFGAGSGPQNIRTAIAEKKPAYYFRKQFAIANPNVDEFILAATCTDDYASVIYPMRLWLNGTEVPGPIEAVSGEGNLVKYFDLTPFANSLRAGTNSVAVMLQNTWQPDWDNVAFDLALKTIPATSAVARFVSTTRGATVGLTMSGPANSVWRLETSDDLKAWGYAQTVTFDAGGNASVNDASSTNARFYRLRSN